MPIALFDLDRTLVRKDTAGLFIRYEYKKGLTSRGRLAQVSWWRLLYTFGLIDSELVARRVLEWYRGRPEAELLAFTEVWFREVVLPLITDKARLTVEEHRARGDLLVVVTASTQYVAHRVAEELRIDHVVCTEVESRDGILTGRVIEPLCYGLGKLAKIRRFFSEAELSPEAALQSATLYTDSITDLPLLEAVANPVVVNPDLRLRKVAGRRGWPVRLW